MSSRCTICRHPQRDSIDVSVLRDGTRFTARRFQVSRPSLDRHKKHLPKSVAAADQAREVAASSVPTTPLLPQLEGLIRHCESALSQAQANKNFPGAMRAIKELRAHFELKYKLESKERKHQGPKDPPEQNYRATESLQETPQDVYKSLAVTTLRLRIRLAARELGARDNSLLTASSIDPLPEYSTPIKFYLNRFSIQIEFFFMFDRRACL